MLDIARDKIAQAGVQSQTGDPLVCDACDRSPYTDDSSDAVLGLGPLYQLSSPADRERAAAELVRVLKPGGVAFIAFMPLCTFLRRTLALKDEQHHLAQPEFVSRFMSKGVFRKDVPNRFNSGHGVRPQEVAPFLEKHGLAPMAHLADTGFAAAQAQQLAELAESDSAAYVAAIEIIISTADDPSLLGASIHLLYVGQRRPWYSCCE
jgi:hypothetical protein